MFDPTTWYRVYCDAPGCIRMVMDYEGDNPLLIESPDVDRIPAGYATDDQGTPWVVWSERNQIMCPDHGHLIEREREIADNHAPLF